MHKLATKRQYLMEDQGYTGDIKINDAVGAHKYFLGLARKNKKLDVGTAWLGKTTYWIVTKALAEAGSASDTEKAEIMMRAITRRDYYFFDVTTDNESISFEFAVKPEDSWLMPFGGDNWLANPQTMKPNPAVKSTPGGNMALVGGLANFKSMVKNLPDTGKKYAGLLQKRTEGTLVPDKNYGSIPKDQWDLYPPPSGTPTTTTPTKQPVKKP
jgi:hypothetical protein